MNRFAKLYDTASNDEYIKLHCCICEHDIHKALALTNYWERSNKMWSRMVVDKKKYIRLCVQELVNIYHETTTIMAIGIIGGNS